MVTATCSCREETETAKGFEHPDTFLKLRDETDPEVRFNVLEELRIRLVEMLAKLFLDLTKHLCRRIRGAEDLNCERLPHQLPFASRLPWPPDLEAGESKIWGHSGCKYYGVKDGAGSFSCDGVEKVQCAVDSNVLDPKAPKVLRCVYPLIESMLVPKVRCFIR